MKKHNLDKPLASILIATKNRPDKLRACLGSLLRNRYQNYEIIIIDQGTKILDWNIFTRPDVLYFHVNTSGKSKALNFGLQKIKGDIVAFTDDDCLVDPYWLENIVNIFKTNNEIDSVFGKILPYKPKNNLGKECPCTFERRSVSIVTKPCLHYKYIGFGSNMAIRRSVFVDIGSFKEWVGPGSIGLGAMDAEFALRMLVYRKKIIYDPKVVVYHNKWLGSKQIFHQNLIYRCGEMACYSYFHFQKHIFASSIVSNNILDSYQKIKINLKEFLMFRWNNELFQTSVKAGIEMSYRMRGLIVGLIYSLIDPIRSKNIHNNII